MSEEQAPQAIVIPCSGIGKAFGSIGREAACIVAEELRPGQARQLCLALLTLGDEDARRLVREHPTIAIDGCPKACASVNIRLAGAEPAATLRVFDAFREHRDLKAQGVSDIGEAGHQMARLLAEEVARRVDGLHGTEGQPDA